MSIYPHKIIITIS